MELAKKKSPLGIVAAIPFLIMALYQVINMTTTLLDGTVALSGLTILYLLLYIGTAVCLLTRQKTVALPVIVILWGVLTLGSVFQNGMTRLEYGFDLGVLINLASQFLGVVTLIIFGVILLINLEEKAQALWILPGVLATLNAVTKIPSFFGQFRVMLEYAPEYLSIFVWTGAVYPLLLAVGIWLASYWFAYPYGPAPKYPQYPYM